MRSEQMKVLEEVRIFLVKNPEEVVFLSCVQDSGVCSNTFCRLTELSSTELHYCVASVLGEYLGPRLQTGSTTRDLVKRWGLTVPELMACYSHALPLRICTSLVKRNKTSLCDKLSGGSVSYCCGITKSVAYPMK